MNPLLILSFLSFISIPIWGQNYAVRAEMPSRVSNNAVTGVTIGDTSFVYSFCGIDESKNYAGIHLHSYKYNVTTDMWTTLPDVTDILGGKIAAGASTVKDKIYIMGGYHVAPNGNEVSSKKTHIFNPFSDTFEEDGADLLTPIDDHVQCVWRDSLIYVITGWSNSTNVNKVQIYNPTTNEWQYGTSTPNNLNFKVFGGSGTIVGDTIYYAGGAKYASNFPATTVLRKGVINPENPLEIAWTSFTDADAKNYRAACINFEGQAVWMGGSHTTYNYDGIAYNGSGGVVSNEQIKILSPSGPTFWVTTDFLPPIMDLRGAAVFEDGRVFIAGGMLNPQEVTAATYEIFINNAVGIEAVLPDEDLSFDILPNPSAGHFQLRPQFKGNYSVKVYGIEGQLIYTEEEVSGLLSLAFLDKKGVLIVEVKSKQKIYTKKVVLN